MQQFGVNKIQRNDFLDIQYKLITKADYEWLEKIHKLTHGRATSIDYKSPQDKEVLKLLFEKWRQKRPMELYKYEEEIERIRKFSYNRHIATDDLSMRLTALIPAYLDMLIKAVWRDQQYDEKFYNWLLTELKVFQVPIKL